MTIFSTNHTLCGALTDQNTKRERERIDAAADGVDDGRVSKLQKNTHTESNENLSN